MTSIRVFPIRRLLQVVALTVAMALAASAQSDPVTREQLVKFMEKMAAGDIAAQLNKRGLAFQLEESDVPNLFAEARRPVSELAALLPILRSFLPKKFDPEEATPRIVEIVNLLTTAGPTDLELLEVIHPAILNDTGQVLSVFDPQRYRKHSLGKVRALPDGRLGVPLYVFTTDAIERLHFAQFLPDTQGNLLLREFAESAPENADFHLGAELDLAETRVREIYRSAFDLQDATAKTVMTEELYASLQERGGWGRMLQGSRPTQSDLQIERSATIDMKSIRPVVHVKHPAGDSTVEYYADFERIDGDLRIVRLRDALGEGDIAADPNLDRYLCQRYETSGCGPYEMRPTEDPIFVRTEELAQLANSYLTDFKGAELKQVAEQMRQGTKNDDDPTGLGYLVAAKFLLGEFYEAEQLAEQALAKGATVRLPVLQYFQDTTSAAHWFGKLILGFSSAGLEYRPSQEVTRKFREMDLSWGAVKEVTVGSKKSGLIPGPIGASVVPFLKMKIEVPDPKKAGKTKKEDWDIAIYPSGCVKPGERFSKEMMQPPSGNACGSQPSQYTVGTPGDTTGGVVAGASPINSGMFSGIKNGENAPTSLLVPREWEQAAVTLQRLLTKYQ